jgi:glycosyltransferase involved in cell wall biosynthesis
MKLSIIIPCYNEVHTVEKLLKKVSICPYDNKEVIVVDDASTDGTKELLQGDLNNLVTSLICHEFNQGKGSALRTGFKSATGDIIIVQDADLEYDPADIPKVVAPIINNQAKVVYGSRFLAESKSTTLSGLQRCANQFLTWLTDLITGLKLTDMETCYKAFKADVIKSIQLKENQFGFEPEVTVKVANKGIGIIEVPISYTARDQHAGKKIGLKDGIHATWCLIKYRYFYKI